MSLTQRICDVVTGKTAQQSIKPTDYRVLNTLFGYTGLTDEEEEYILLKHLSPIDLELNPSIYPKYLELKEQHEKKAMSRQERRAYERKKLKEIQKKLSTINI